MTERDNTQVFGKQQAESQGFATSNVMKDSFGLDLPVASVPLPSQGKIYPEGSPLHNADVVEIKAMTAREEDILTSRVLIKKGTVISELLKSCIINKNIDVDSLLIGDRNAIMTAIRVTGYGSQYQANVGCPACGENSEQSFSLSDLPIRRLEIDPSEPGQNLFEFTLPMTQKVVKFKFLTGQDENDMSVEAERKKKLKITSGVENNVTSRLKYSIVAIGNETNKAKLAQFALNMPARDSRALRSYIEKNEPGVEMKSWINCPHCGEHSEVALPIGASFFWPDA